MKSSMFTICLVALVTAGSAYTAFGGPMGRALTPEEHLMYVQQERGPHWRALTPQQRCEQHQQMQRVWASMSPADLQNLKQQLDARWNALPTMQKQRLEQRIQQRVANRGERRMVAPAPGRRPCVGANSAPL
jgi:Spy/CpxP family protein refolding chaperone